MELMIGAFVFLAAGVIAVPIASRLGLGSVLGYLIAGAIIGPSVLGLVTDAEHIMHFAEFGVVMMLFLIGLELQPALLWRMRRPIVGLGGLQVALTTLIIFGIALIFGQTWQTALAIGLILSLSSTAIALQIFAEKNLMKTDGGKSGFAVLLFQDIAVIPIIALLPLLAINAPLVTQDDGHSSNLIANLPGWQQTLIVIAVVGAIILAGRYLTRPLFRFIAESNLREIFTAAALLLVVGISLLMNMVGLSPALGAFTAGVVLADNEYRHELEANIDPFKALLLGLFFISVGAGIDFGLLGEQPLLIGGIVIALILIKFAILWGLAQLFGVSGGDRYWLAFGLAQGGEFGFVLLSYTLQNNVLPTETIAILTAAIALSMVLTPILIVANEKWVQPLFRNNDTNTLEETMDDQDTPVILAGFGRYGQIVGRLLMSSDIPVTVLDNSASHIERVRRFGFKVFYGDASREDLLHTAGAGKAKLLIITVDNRDQIEAILNTAKHSFPHLKVITRAYDLQHYYELKELGADHIEREVLQASLKTGEQALQILGMRAYQARRKSQLFAIHDNRLTEHLGAIREDSQLFMSEARQAEEEMMQILRAEQKRPHENSNDHAWDPATNLVIPDKD